MSEIEKKVREVAGRLAALRALEIFFIGLLVAAGVFCLLVVVHKIFYINLYHFYVLPALVVISGIVAFASSITTRRSVHAAAIRVDNELKLKERLSTAMTSGSDASPFTPLMLADAKRHAENIVVGNAFPIRVKARAWIIPILLFTAGALLSLVDPLDVFGRGEAERELEAEKKVVVKAIRKMTDRLEKMKKERKFEQADEEVKKFFKGVLKETKKLEERPKNIKKAMKDLKAKEDEVSEKAKKYAKMADKVSSDATKEGDQLKKLLQDIPKMMKKGEIDKLMNRLKTMKETIEKSSKLTKEEKKALKKDLDRMRSLLARKKKSPGAPDVILPAEFRKLMSSLNKGKYATLLKELSPAEKERLKKLLTNKNYLKKLKQQLRQAQQQLAKGGG
ncbi:MAG: hypothetical protein E3J72_15760 [Planctomycetota bacterium]|nr:MAG: hypothetical protein E3J72_15760 [Planctomycetota bacterium]